MTICCRIDHHQIHCRLRHMVGPTREWARGQTAQDPTARIKGASGKISRNEQGLGASKSFCWLADALRLTLPQACLPRSGLVSFSFDSFSPVRPPALAAKLPPKDRILA